ncbi:hypothetical protein OPT61_g8051 [Boeremia exigua]|uniref:Uncharacterized protein n=1 Tax=Boeremia exigua TaxID=749465 RepID=A0ACC2HZX4_9PLEO|nr:hypothetical protein OPT61_g8051 [Boeremia exigua]
MPESKAPLIVIATLIIDTVTAAPTDPVSKTMLSVADIAGLVTMILTVPTAWIAIEAMAHRRRRERARVASHSAWPSSMRRATKGSDLTLGLSAVRAEHKGEKVTNVLEKRAAVTEPGGYANPVLVALEAATLVVAAVIGEPASLKITEETTSPAQEKGKKTKRLET